MIALHCVIRILCPCSITSVPLLNDDIHLSFPHFFWYFEVRTKYLIFCRWHFQMDFHQWKFWIVMKILFDFVPQGQINNKPTLVQLIVCHWTGYTGDLNQWWPGSLTHTYVTQPQWVTVISQKDFKVISKGWTSISLKKLCWSCLH